jgi:hypothetical protein
MDAMDFVSGEKCLTERAEIEPLRTLRCRVMPEAAIVEIEAINIRVGLHKTPR